MGHEINPLSRKILRELCNDARVSITKLSKDLNIPRYVASRHIESLEKELGLRYTLELNYNALGLENIHIIHVNFTKKPKAAELEELFKKSRVILFAATTTGDFDLVVVALAKDSEEYLSWETGFGAALSKYGASTWPSEVGIMHHGFVPPSDDAIRESNIDEIYKKLLLGLNDNSRVSIRELSEKVGMREDLTRYYLLKMEKDKILKRYTAVVTKPPLTEHVVFFGNYTVREGIEDAVDNERRRMYWRIPDDFPVVNEYQETWTMSGSDRTFAWAIYDNYNQGVEMSVGTLKQVFAKHKPVVEVAKIDKIVKGFLPIRNIDVKANYVTTTWVSSLF